MSTPGICWPRWEEVRSAWESLEVPDVTIVPFDIGTHYSSLPWVSLATGKQLIDNTSPNRWTARALCEDYPNLSEDHRIAFKLLTVARRYQLDVIKIRLLLKVPGFDIRDWWSANSIYVLPPTDYTFPTQLVELHRFDERPAARAWREFVAASADVWKAMAARWAVIRIPDFMDYDGSERAAWDAHLASEREKRERAEYAYLRTKYGSDG